MKTLYYKVEVTRIGQTGPQRKGIFTVADEPSGAEAKDREVAKNAAIVMAENAWNDEDGIENEDDYEAEILEIIET